MKLIVALFFCVSFAYSQTNDSQLAYQYFQNGEYVKAIEIYKELSKGYSFTQYYHPYFQCLVLSEKFSEAKKLTIKMIKRNDNHLPYKVDLYMIHRKINEDKNASKVFKNIQEKLKKEYTQIVNVSNKFSGYALYQEALDLYLLVEKFSENNKKFPIQKAQLYQLLSNDEKMVNEYLEYLKGNPSQRITVINYLQRYLDNNGIENDKHYNYVKNGLLRFSQKEKDTYVFSELLIWLFMQNNEFNLAYLQAKALDKRLNEDGERLYDLAETFLDNNYFDLAVKCYKYIIDKGSDNYYFIDAHINLLFALGEKENTDLDELDLMYFRTIEELGEDYTTVLLLNNYAYFKAFSMSDLSSAQLILERIMSIPGISKNDLAECKLVYADVMLLSGNVWTSLLYYSQVEKEHKESPIGHEAKLRRAKISYYQGDFNWAQSQLDVLKSSTSKLISNDAMDLSLLITDNLNLDTTSVPMEIYARADLLYYQNKFEESIITLDSICDLYSGHALIDEIYFRKYQIYNKIGEIDKGIEMLELIVSDYSYDILNDDALFNLAQIYEIKKKDSKKAIYYYESILLECNGSIYTSESRKKYRHLRGDDL
tara:strand:+ start:1690 stop:3477 length:1788 start_codon:yes stop_codon:yes gene_type:complete